MNAFAHEVPASEDGGAVSSRTQVLEAIVQLSDAGELPTRERIAQKTGLRMTTVDDRIKLLRAQGLIAAQRQCYRPTYSHGPARPLSVTTMDGGALVKIEWGDEVVTLTTSEAADLGRHLMGWATQSSALARVEQLGDDLLRMSARLRHVEGSNQALRKKLKMDARQQALGFE